MTLCDDSHNHLEFMHIHTSVPATVFQISFADWGVLGTVIELQ